MSRRALPRTIARVGGRWLGEAVRRAWEVAADYGAIHPGSPRAERFGRLGAGSLIAFPPADLFGERWMDIGEEVLVSPHATLTVGYGPDQVEGLGPDPHLVIGDRCVVNVGCVILAHTSITLGDDVWLGRNVFITDTDHGYTDLDTPIGRQMGPLRPVSIGSGSWLGHGVVVLSGSTIGRHVVVAANSVVTGDVPDRCVVAGAPARVVKRHVEGDTWERVTAEMAAADRLAARSTNGSANGAADGSSSVNGSATNGATSGPSPANGSGSPNGLAPADGSASPDGSGSANGSVSRDGAAAGNGSTRGAAQPDGTTGAPA